MNRRGDQLREHILWVAKDVFLEAGFERASMDLVAARAETSKRSLYAHFANKETLFLAVIELLRNLFLSKLKMPSDYSDDTAEALTLFCARYLEILLFERSIQMCRLVISEAARFPGGAAQFFDVMFAEVERRLSTYLKPTCGLSVKASSDAANTLLGRVLHPRLERALFGMDKLAKSFDDHTLSANFDLKPIRKAVSELIDSLSA